MSAAGCEPQVAIWWLVFLQLPEANQNAGVDYWRPVLKVLALRLACTWLDPLWRLGKTNILSQRAAHSVQIGYAVPKAQEKPSASFI